MPYANLKKRRAYHKRKNREWYLKNKERHCRKSRRRHKRNYVPHPPSGKYIKDPVRYRKAQKLWIRFGITLEQHEALIRKQNNKCAICRDKLLRPHTDHCHKTGKVRGILCQGCNLGLGLFKDSKYRLRRAIRYLP